MQPQPKLVDAHPGAVADAGSIPAASMKAPPPGFLPIDGEIDSQLVLGSDHAGCMAVARTAVMTTSATSFGWEIITTWEAPSISVTVASMRS
jgi:hypothetical protein